MQIITIPIPPMGKPRMTRLGKHHPKLKKYWSYCDAVRAYASKAAESCTGKISWTAYFPIPKSWPKWKKTEMAGGPHRLAPDRDNIDKGILDALFKEDSHIYCGSLLKLWDDGKGPRIELMIE